MPKKHTGLSPAEVEASRRKNGSNRLVKLKRKGLVRRFFDNLSDPIIRILLIALGLEVVFTLGNCNFFEIFGIIIAILIATVVSTLSEYGSEASFAKMEAESLTSMTRVIREGAISTVLSDELVVGDIILVSRGEALQADATVMEGELSVDQSALNGENQEVEKRSGNTGKWELSNSSLVFRGSVVTAGEAVCRVERVGSNTYYGMVANAVQSDTRESPLKLRLTSLAKIISRIGYFVAFLVGFVYLFSELVVNNGFVLANIISSVSDFPYLFSVLLHALTLVITVIVVAVPEGLPMMITVVLTANMKRLIKDKILVKKLVGIETSGSLSILFTDKTGTLTEGKLSVDRIICEDGIFKSVSELKGCGELFDKILLCAKYNTSAETEDGMVIGGNSTDRAIAEFFISEKVSRAEIKDKQPFSSETKMSSVTLSDGTKFIKGASEVLLFRSRSFLSQSGDVIVSELSAVRDEYDKAVKRGERVIALTLEENGALIFLCLIVLKDKLRHDVKESVASVARAGIQVVMVTGDNRETAVGIAEECGIFRERRGDLAMSSDELALLSDYEVKELLPRLRVVARSLPQDKTRLVRLSEELGLVVGMTGDGINDAPSLKLADVGFAMGSGTDIAKSAGDIVILDNSFSAICKAVLFGRTIFKSIRKFITFQLIMNLAACGITLIGRFIGVDTPITIIQMLWVNIIMDTLGGLAFAGEAPLKYYMKEKPKRRDEPLLSREMVSKILLNGGYTLALLITFITHGFFRGVYTDSTRHMTAFYALFIFAGLFNCLASRSDRLLIWHGILKNKLFIGILSFISVIQIIIIYFGGALFRSTPLTPKELFVAIFTAFTVLVFDGIRRVFTKLK